jgi:hypothetical protein
MMRNYSAIQISANWHSGQWSALYQFASSGVYMVENHLRYLQEVETCLHPEYDLHPSILNKTQKGNLVGLKWYFIRMGEKNGIKTMFKKHSIYGYLIPFVTDNTPSELVNKIQPLKYLA